MVARNLPLILGSSPYDETGMLSPRATIELYDGPVHNGKAKEIYKKSKTVYGSG